MWQTVEFEKLLLVQLRLLHLYGTFNLWIREWRANKPKSLNYGVKSPAFQVCPWAWEEIHTARQVPGRPNQ